MGKMNGLKNPSGSKRVNSGKDAAFGRCLAGWYLFKLEGVRIYVPMKS